MDVNAANIMQSSCKGQLHSGHYNAANLQNLQMRLCSRALCTDSWSQNQGAWSI